MSVPAMTTELIPIKSETRTIQTCFQRCLYEVPNFQRPYSWDADALEQYWDDVVLAKGDFFFGSTVTWVSQKRELFSDTYSIIDGQQRLTTSAIALSVVRDAFSKLAQDSDDAAIEEQAKRQSEATQKYLINTDEDEGRDYKVIERPEPMFFQYIQQPSAIPSRAKWNDSAQRIGAARDFFEKRISECIVDLVNDDAMDRLKEIRSNILKARLIQVELASEADGFLIFETLNTRGTDLRLADLVKNLLIRGAGSPEDRTTIANRWEALADSVETSSTGADALDRFIWQSWNSRRDAVKMPALFKSISKFTAQEHRGYLTYLEELEADAMVYVRLDNEDLSVDPKRAGKRRAFEVAEFVDSVRALAVFDVSVANSALLSLARKFETTRVLSQKALIEAVQAIEKFHFQFNALTASSSTGGTRSRYNRFAVQLERATSSAQVNEAIKELKDRLRASLPKQALATQAFSQLFYAPKLRLNAAQKRRGRKAFIAYVLVGLARPHKVFPRGQNPATFSIEHLKPQAQAVSASVEDPVFSIGNLVLLTSELNAELGDGDLSKKSKALTKSGACFDVNLGSWVAEGVHEISDAQILERTTTLARAAIEEVWAI